QASSSAPNLYTCSSPGNSVCAGWLCTCSGWFKHSEPHRTYTRTTSRAPAAGAPFRRCSRLVSGRCSQESWMGYFQRPFCAGRGRGRPRSL
ncbi:hypothetical protein GBAR_LOCUS16987, partial [Geodia barretti]